jgi:cell division protein FtsQ
MKKRTLIRALLSIALTAYLVIALSFTGSLHAGSVCRGMTIEIIDSTACRFVTAEGIDQELGGLVERAPGMKLADIDTDQVERRLNQIDDIEECQCVRLANGVINLSVTPMRPVARVFNPDGSSYYINRHGKRMRASLRYRMDVPLIVNEGSAAFDATSLLPLLSTLRRDSLWNSLVTAVNVTRGGDVVLVPALRGHVINLGDTSALDDKLGRVLTIYHKALPVKGWTLYDTISAKWKGQIVATRRDKALNDINLYADNITDEEGDDEGTMTADSTAVNLDHRRRPTP